MKRGHILMVSAKANPNYHYFQQLSWRQHKKMALNQELRKAMLKEWPFLGDVIMTGNLKVYAYPTILLKKNERFKKLKDGEDEMKCESLKGDIFSIPYELLTCGAIQVADKLIGEAIVRSYGG